MKGVYISIDVDCLDPAFTPGVSHIEPGGLFFLVMSLTSYTIYKLILPKRYCRRDDRHGCCKAS
ncbi:Arginase protein [Dioscorea alata]|uniref:Arginase protein n=1 Tax=Dioscorea alata TaxID=55571 RepID=A0ACB7U6Z2_DIOAL|nr:Arginase protein [Dioscorea alata]